MNAGYLTLARWRGVPVRFHWTVPLGAFLLGGMRWDPPFWLGFLMLVLVHESGHALVVRACRRQVLAIDVHGAGGLCRWSGAVSPMQRAAIAWGGVWAQMVLAAVVMVVSALHPPATPFAATLDEVFVDRNLWVIALNLLPFAPLDGEQAWALPGLLYDRARKSLRARAARERSLAARSDPAAGAERTSGPRMTADPVDDPRLREEIARLEKGDAAAETEVRPEVDKLLSRIHGLGRDKPN